jgi:DNA-binding XRE family transcriptional regulator
VGKCPKQIKGKLYGGVVNLRNFHRPGVQSAADFLRERLKHLRNAAGLTQEQYAEIAGIPYKVYQHIEAGRRDNPRLSTIEKLAAGFGLTVTELFAKESPKPSVRKRKPGSGRK